MAMADVASAKARIVDARARENLGDTGAENASIISAMAKLEKAQLDLARSKIYAPTDSGVTNVRDSASSPDAETAIVNDMGL